MKIILFMVVSPGEEQIANDSLARALAYLPSHWPHPELLVADNTQDGFIPTPGSGWPTMIIHRVPDAPRPYYEIARTVGGAFLCAHSMDADLLIKIDPDTVVCSSDFFTDLERLHADSPGDFYSWFVRYRGVRNNLVRILRLIQDCLPFGLSRHQGGDRYGKRLKFKLGPAWHFRATTKAILCGRLPRAQPAGGGYAVKVAWLNTPFFVHWAQAKGPNGLEWNDDTLLPIAVRASGGRIVDIRKTKLGAGWRWMHGSRYFTLEQALAPGLRALHPLKDNPNDWKVRRSLPDPSASP